MELPLDSVNICQRFQGRCPKAFSIKELHWISRVDFGFTRRKKSMFLIVKLLFQISYGSFRLFYSNSGFWKNGLVSADVYSKDIGPGVRKV